MTTTAEPSAPPARPGRKIPHPVAIVTWLAIAVGLIAVLVTAAGHHSPAASRTARRAVHQAPVASAPAPAATTAPGGVQLAFASSCTSAQSWISL